MPGAVADMGALRIGDPRALATVVHFLSEADADTDLIYKFTQHGDVNFEKHTVNVKGWVAARSKGNNLFRIRILNTPATNYRVVYGFNWHKQRIAVLAVAHKDEIDYEITAELAKRILSDWDVATGGRGT